MGGRFVNVWTALPGIAHQCLRCGIIVYGGPQALRDHRCEGGYDDAGSDAGATDGDGDEDFEWPDHDEGGEG